MYLAAISIRGNEVYRVCNFTRRRYVKSFPLIGYWLSVVPFMPFVKKWFTSIACTILPEAFASYEAKTDDTGSDRLSAETIMRAIAWSQSSDITSRFREVRNKTSVASTAAGFAVRSMQPAPPPVGGTTLTSTDLVGKSSEAATEIAASKGLRVQTKPFDPTVGASAITDVAGLFRTAEPGDQVTLFADDAGQVRFYEIAKSAPADIVGPDAAPDVTRLQSQLTQAQTQLNQTLIQLTTLQTQQAQRDGDLAELRTQLGELSAAHRELRAQVAPPPTPPAKRQTRTPRKK
jgi:hypothetical protein